jgi:hypothetical protein
LADFADRAGGTLIALAAVIVSGLVAVFNIKERTQGYR